ncbi:MAG: hypothetical protein MI919_08515, partial [Holophagales bacterium]|nr:hypothetical protein [Holophagales bacterium]
MTMNVKQRSKVESELIRKVWADEALQARLLADPTAVYGDAAREAGAALSEGTEVRVLQESADSLYLVIPNAEATTEA